MAQRLAASAFSAILAVSSFLPGHHEPGHTFIGISTESGTRVKTLSAASMSALAENYYRNVVAQGPFYDYAGVSVCGGPTPGEPDADNICPLSWGICRITTGGGDGPGVVVFRREVSRAGVPVSGDLGQWERVDLTCFPERVPGATNVLTMAMIRAAFRDTDFTVPTVNIQPEGDVTLVNLPTYFETRFPDDGFGPDEVDTPDPGLLQGQSIEIRPRLKSVTYHLGETVIGPTTSLGGPHPTGDIRATYTRAGSHDVRADIVYTGQFRVAGSGWIDIPGEVDLQGTPVTLTVREARSRLYTP